jgi:hypothetical protein
MIMDHFVVFPVNEDGIFLNPKLVGKALDDAMSKPFMFSDLFVYSHGWWTTGNDAMALYGQYTIEFAKTFLSIPNIQNPPTHSFGVGIHWPSTLSEDAASVREKFEAISYYQMGSRADQVGVNGLFATMRRALRARQENGNVPIRLTIIGHSFGCRVVCSGLQMLAKDLTSASTPTVHRNFLNATQIRLILLQAAFKNDEFEDGGKYDGLIQIPNLKILVTTSELDLALNKWFSTAEKANNMAHHQPGQAVALGAGITPKQPSPGALAPGGGPTLTTSLAYNAFQNGSPIQVSQNFAYGDVPILAPNERMLVADLTSLHAARLAGPNPAYEKNNFSGSHSDISTPEIYNLIAGFAFPRE